MTAEEKEMMREAIRIQANFRGHQERKRLEKARRGREAKKPSPAKAESDHAPTLAEQKASAAADSAHKGEAELHRKASISSGAKRVRRASINAMYCAAHAIAEADEKMETYEMTLCFFPRDNLLRRKCVQLCESANFERFILLVIFFSSASLSFERPDLGMHEKSLLDRGLEPEFFLSQQMKNILFVCDWIFTTIFIVELLVKVIANGLAFGEKAYIKSWANVLDGVIVTTSVLNLVWGEGTEAVADGATTNGFGVMRVMRVLRALRPLQAMKRMRGMSQLVATLKDSVTAVAMVMGLIMFFSSTLAVLLSQLYGGTQWSCSDGPGEAIIAQVSTSFRSNFSTTMREDLTPWEHGCAGSFAAVGGVIGQRRWLNAEVNFDNFGNSLMTVLELLTLEDWPSIMAQVVSARGHHLSPQPNYRPHRVVVLFVIVLTGSFFLLNLFVGVVVTSYNTAKAAVEERLKDKKEKEKQLKLAKSLVQGSKALVTIHEGDSKLHQMLCEMVDSSTFEFAILGLIFLNVAAMACEHQGMSQAWRDGLGSANTAFTLLFIAEAVLKLGAHGARWYFDDGWNVFDFCLVSVSGVELVAAGWLPVSPTLARMFRVFKVARVVRVADKAKGLRNLILTFVQVVPYLLNIIILIVLLFFIYSVMGVSLFANVKWQLYIGRHTNFTSFWQALLTLLRTTTGEGWNGMMHNTMAQPPFCERELGNCGPLYVAPAFWLSFMLFTVYMALNLYIAVILNTFFDLTIDDGLRAPGSVPTASHVHDFQRVWAKYDPRGRGIVPGELLQSLLEDIKPPLMSAFASKRALILSAARKTQLQTPTVAERDFIDTARAGTYFHHLGELAHLHHANAYSRNAADNNKLVRFEQLLCFLIETEFGLHIAPRRKAHYSRYADRVASVVEGPRHDEEVRKLDEANQHKWARISAVTRDAQKGGGAAGSGCRSAADAFSSGAANPVSSDNGGDGSPGGGDDEGGTLLEVLTAAAMIQSHIRGRQLRRQWLAGGKVKTIARLMALSKDDEDGAEGGGEELSSDDLIRKARGEGLQLVEQSLTPQTTATEEPAEPDATAAAAEP